MILGLSPVPTAGPGEAMAAEKRGRLGTEPTRRADRLGHLAHAIRADRWHGLGLNDVLVGDLLNHPASNPYATEWETIGVHLNDAPFDSDGAGPAGSLAGAVRRGDLFVGGGIFGVTPELKVAGNFRRDPLQEKGRIAVWAGGRDRAKLAMLGGVALPVELPLDYALAARGSVEGGFADEIALDLLEAIHGSIGVGNRALRSTNDESVSIGLTGHARMALPLGGTRFMDVALAPFAYGSLGFDVTEAAAGLQLAVQPAGQQTLPFLMTSKTGAHAPMFGGDGVSVFALARGVAHDEIYGGLEEALVLEGGVTAQATVARRLRFGLGAACAGKLYRGAPKASCVASFRSGLQF